MPRLICIDYGSKRCGIAVTDPLQIIVQGLETVSTPDLFDFIRNYVQKEQIEKMFVGMPIHKDGTETYLAADIRKFVTKINADYPEIPVIEIDEQFTSVRAKSILIEGGVKKKDRRDKAEIDKVSAVIMLQQYLGHI